MKSRRVLSYLIVCLLLLAIVSNAFSQDENSFTISRNRYARVSVLRGNLNLRKSPLSSSQVINRIPNNSIIQVENESPTWCKVLYNNKKGFVMSEFLEFIDELPFETISVGDAGKNVLEFKKRMQELGYFRPGANDLDEYFSITSEGRLKILQKINGLEETGVATPELQAFIFWGSVKKNNTILPPAPYYVAAPAIPSPTPEQTLEPTDAPTTAPAQTPSPTPVLSSELSVEINNMNTRYETIEKDAVTYINSITTFNYVISGGNPPYNVNASFNIYNDSSSPHTKIVSGGNGVFSITFLNNTKLSGRPCSLTLVVTDNAGHTDSDKLEGKM